jgi:hypothetical protein
VEADCAARAVSSRTSLPAAGAGFRCAPYSARYHASDKALRFVEGDGGMEPFDAAEPAISFTVAPSMSSCHRSVASNFALTVTAL